MAAELLSSKLVIIYVISDLQIVKIMKCLENKHTEDKI